MSEQAALVDNLTQPDFSKLNIRDREFNDTSIELIASWYQYYGDLFLTSEENRALPKEMQQELPEILSSFSDFCYSYHLQKPGQWDKKAVYEVCAFIMPRKVMADDLFFKSIVPGMVAFLQWAEHRGILTKTTVLQKTIRASEKELLANSANPHYWGIGKSLFMGAQTKGIDVDNQQAMNPFVDHYNKNQTAPPEPEKLVRRAPKQKNEIYNLEDILEDLRYLRAGFPEAAIDAAIDKKEEITPILLDTLDHALKHYESLGDDDFSALYAVYLLAKFREKKAFSKIMAILHLPGTACENILGEDGVTDYGIKNIIASVFNGDLEKIYQLAEDKNAYEYARATAIESLLPLYTSGQVSYETVIDYYRHLIEGGLEKHQPFLWGILACAIMDLHAIELYEPMKTAFQAGLIDPTFVGLREFEDVFSKDQETAEQERLYEHYHLIDDVVKEMSWWACFTEDTQSSHSNDTLMNAMSWEPNQTVYYEYPKTGRNDPCPCGSGQKYKKCCLH